MKASKKGNIIPFLLLLISAIAVLFFSARYILLKRADQYYLQGDFQGAYDIYSRFSRDMADMIQEMHPMVALQAGASVTFGRYEQDGNTENGKEPIKWTILTKEKNKVLLFSEKILDCRPFEEPTQDAGGIFHDLDDWLNDGFFYSAFTAEEQTRIKRYDSEKEPYRMYTRNPVFIMNFVSMEGIYSVSYKTVKDALAPHDSLKGIQTKYVMSKYPYNAGRWWVDGDGLLIKGNGSLGSSEKTDSDVGVRPMIWLEQ